jgi:hypothetical protein
MVRLSSAAMSTRAATRRLQWWQPFAILGVLLLAVVNGWLVADQIRLLGVSAPWAAADFRVTFVGVLAATNPYDVQSYLWSPVALPILAAVIPLGLVVWRLLHGAALLLISDWRVAALVAVSWPFWWDLGIAANVATFVFVAAWAALRGNRVGVWATFAMAVLMPRPLIVPVVAGCSGSGLKPEFPSLGSSPCMPAWYWPAAMPSTGRTSYWPRPGRTT